VNQQKDVRKPEDFVSPRMNHASVKLRLGGNGAKAKIASVVLETIKPVEMEQSNPHAVSLVATV